MTTNKHKWGVIAATEFEKLMNYVRLVDKHNKGFFPLQVSIIMQSGVWRKHSLQIEKLL